MVEVCDVLETAATFQTSLSCFFSLKASKEPRCEDLGAAHSTAGAQQAEARSIPDTSHWAGGQSGTYLEQYFPTEKSWFPCLWALSLQGHTPGYLCPASVPGGSARPQCPSHCHQGHSGERLFWREGTISAPEQRITGTLFPKAPILHLPWAVPQESC